MRQARQPLLPQRVTLVDDYLRDTVVPCPAPVGGRLALFLSAWKDITQDVFVLSIISHGFRISLNANFPGVIRQVTNVPRDQKALLSIQGEIRDLISKNAIVQIDDFPNLCLSPIFVIPKSSGDLRVILNLKQINLFIPVQHFRMETLSVILPQLSPQDWAATIDLKDAYLHVPIHQESHRLLGFSFQDRTYLYKVLPFGLKDSPWVFTRLVATVIAYLRLQGIRIFYYLDDWLVVASSQDLLVSHLRLTLEVTQRLGFLINWKKSFLVPQRIPCYLGACLDIPLLLARPQDHRIMALQSLIQELVSSGSAPASLWQKFLGHLTSLVDFVPNCGLLMRPLQLHLQQFFNQFFDPVSLQIPLPPNLRSLVLQWSSLERLSEGKPFLPPPPSLTLTTDASRLGWGAVLPPHRVSGLWSREVASLHINSLELLAVLQALQSFEDVVKGRSVLVRSDNMTVVSYINHQGGTHSPSLCRLAIDLWEWCLPRQIHLSASHIPGEDNLLADFLSRGRFLPSEWMLKTSVFQSICQVLSPPPEIDLFASLLNFQLPKYCSRSRDPQAWRVDAMSFPWSGLHLYAFPPFSMIPRVLEKVVQDEAEIALIAPYWPRRPWFPKLLSLLAGLPRGLPCQSDLIAQPLSLLPHQRIETLHLSLWPLSGIRVNRQVFLTEQQNSPQRPSETPLALLTIPNWDASLSGAHESIVIPLLPL